MGKLYFELTNPCEQDWTAMTEADNGRFCNACEKIVLNFADMTDAEVLEFFQKPGKRINSCGRFTEKQLTEGISMPKHSQKSKTTPFKKIAATLIGLSMAGLPILVNGQTIIEVQQPPEYDTIQKKVLVKPAEIKLIEVPAEYTTVKSRRLVRGGGFVEFREMACVQPIPEDAPIPIAKVQQKLKERGFYQGAIDNVLGPKTKEAVIEFRKANFLGVQFRITPYMLDLLGIKMEG